MITLTYSTNESIKSRKDAIAGVSYISDKGATVNWKYKDGLSAGKYEQLITSSDSIIVYKKDYVIEEGPSDWLSSTTNKILGSPVINNKPIAVLLQYNIIYLKIGIVTIFIALFVVIISPFIKKLMHGIH